MYLDDDGGTTAIQKHLITEDDIFETEKQRFRPSKPQRVAFIYYGHLASPNLCKTIKHRIDGIEAEKEPRPTRMTTRSPADFNVASADELNIIMSTEDLVPSSHLDRQPCVPGIENAALKKLIAEFELASDMTKKQKQ